jgi:hypothetical protein
MKKAARQLSLVKGDHQYLFRYQPGNEADVIGAFASLASDGSTEFDWFDAAVLSYQMGRRLEVELDELRS